MFAPFLQEIGIALRLGDDQVDSVVLDSAPSFSAGRTMASRASGGLKGPISGKSKSRSAYDFASPIRPRKLRKSRAYDCDRQLLLRTAMKC